MIEMATNLQTHKVLGRYPKLAVIRFHTPRSRSRSRSTCRPLRRQSPPQRLRKAALPPNRGNLCATRASPLRFQDYEKTYEKRECIVSSNSFLLKQC